MELYHGSIEIIENPVMLERQRLLDFGKGFYTTSNKKQAERWAVIKQNREQNNTQAFVSVYTFNENLLESLKLQRKEFNQANEEWLDFVIQNRNQDFKHGYDIVIGPVANDTLYQTLTLYESGILTKPETIQRLKVHPLYDQIVFNTAKALKLLYFQSSFEVHQN